MDGEVAAIMSATHIESFPSPSRLVNTMPPRRMPQARQSHRQQTMPIIFGFVFEKGEWL